MTPYIPSSKVTIALTPTPLGYSDLPDGLYSLRESKLVGSNFNKGQHSTKIVASEKTVSLSFPGKEASGASARRLEAAESQS